MCGNPDPSVTVSGAGPLPGSQAVRVEPRGGTGTLRRGVGPGPPLARHCAQTHRNVRLQPAGESPKHGGSASTCLSDFQRLEPQERSLCGSGAQSVSLS